MEDEVFPLESSKYKLNGLIGRGATATVYAATCLTNDIDVALKVIDLEISPMDLESIRSEISLWSFLDDPNLVKYYTSFVEQKYLYIVMEYMDIGSAREILSFKFKDGIQKENIISAILKKILHGLVYFHTHQKIHRDIKAGNILIDKEGNVKLGDFGIAASMIENGQKIDARFTVVGTPCYMAPEVICAGHGYTEKADIWSLGITAIELATGSAPYSNLHPLEVVVKVTNSAPPSLPKTFSSQFRDFVNCCLQRNPEKRPTAEELLNHNFITLAASQKRLCDYFGDLPNIQKQYQINHNKYRKSSNSSPRKSKNQTNNNENDEKDDADPHLSWNFDVDSNNSKNKKKSLNEKASKQTNKNTTNDIVQNAPSEIDIIDILKNKISTMKNRIAELKNENRSLNDQIDSLFLQLNELII